ncbi:hypothetical protein R9C00_24735 [Flammeovirgaceae bacterium SG7u.111]|nr:hypothetical protein [Flammeovirgaceae bacterium SG7u.132]WPO34905.1 hypothetical protein R9C00_24735 [Flammeovirgaceae bacterium SG7u.111]
MTKKNLFISLALQFVVSLSILAQGTKTVSINPNIPAQYTDIQSALDAADAGDTLFIHPASDRYDGEDSIFITKPLVLIGGGIYNDSLEYGGLETKFNRIVLTGAADNSTIANMMIERLVIRDSVVANTTFDGITITSNYINRIDLFSTDSVFSSSDFVIKNNIIKLVFFNAWEAIEGDVKLAIENNIIGQIANGNGDEFSIRNNIFNPAIFGGTALFNVSGATIFNNIFYGYTEKRGIGTKSCNNNIFDYNLTQETNDDLSGGTDNVFGSNNIENTNPLWVSRYSYFSSLDNIMRSNFELQEGSPAKDSGSAGTNIGLTGGRFPFNPRVRFGYPHVRSIEINNPVLGADNVLKFTIEGIFPN